MIILFETVLNLYTEICKCSSFSPSNCWNETLSEPPFLWSLFFPWPCVGFLWSIFCFFCTSWLYYNHGNLIQSKQNMYKQFIFCRHWNSRPAQRQCQMWAMYSRQNCESLQLEEWPIFRAHYSFFPAIIALEMWDIFWMMVFIQKPHLPVQDGVWISILMHCWH